MTELLHKQDSTELWSVGGQVVQLALPNWGTMGVYAQVWSGPGVKWELLWHLERPAIHRALQQKADVEAATEEDRAALLDIAATILGAEPRDGAVTIREIASV